MSGDFSRASAHPVPLSPEELRRRTFTNSFRGYDQGEVREFLESVAAELDRLIRSELALRRELETARQAPPTPPKLDEAALTAALGAEAAQILHTAHEASADLRRKAEENAARILKDAQVQADATRAASDSLMGDRTAEAESAAEAIRAAAQAEAHAVVARAREQAEASLTEARTRFDAMAEEAEALKVRVLGDLTRRRRTVLAQVEQLGAGRDSMLRAVADVRRLIDEVTGSLQGLESEARTAAIEALERARRAEDVDAPVIEEVSRAALGAGSLGEPPPPPESVEAPLYSQSAPSVAALRIHAQPAGPSPTEAAVPPEAPAAPAIDVPSEPVTPVVASEPPSPVPPPIAPSAAKAPSPPTSPTSPMAPTTPVRMFGAPVPRPAPPRVAPRPVAEEEPEDSEPEVPMVSERRISSLRILRRREDRRHPSANLMDEPDEGVRIIRPSATAEAEPATEPETGAGTDVPVPAEVPATTDVSAEPEPEAEIDLDVEVGTATESFLAAEVEPAAGVEPAWYDEPAAVQAQAEPTGESFEAATETEAGIATPEPSGTTEPGPTETAAEAYEGESRPSVDELFARLRAEREAAKVEAEAVLSELPAPQATAEGAATGTEPSDIAGAETDDSEAAAPAAPDDPGEEHGPDADERASDELLERRNRLTAPVHDRLARKLKRALQDDQNDLLDRARSRSRHSDADPLPGEVEHAARFRLAAAEALDDAFRAGSDYAMTYVPGSGPAEGPNGSEEALALAEELVTELRSRLSRALAEPDMDEVGTADAVGAVYRSWKGARIETLAMDHVIAGFGRGVLASVPSDARLTWVVDDDGGPCPDCDDNGLAGPTPAGEAFPTGQVHPPAHAGCRCLLMPGLP